MKSNDVEAVGWLGWFAGCCGFVVCAVISAIFGPFGRVGRALMPVAFGCAVFAGASLFAGIVASLFKETPNFPRTSQNHTASGGVEGAHEGTTADKSGSREPEKLNNAHFEQVLESKAHQATCKHENAQLVCLSCGLGIRQGNSALAESSLSSPPRMLPADKSLGDVPHFGCEYPRGICDCYAGVEEEKW